MESKEIIIASSVVELAKNAVGIFNRLNSHYAQSTGKFTVGLAGGTTPQAMYKLLAEEPWQSGIDWCKIHFFFSDERFVPLENEESNFFSIKKVLLDNIAVPETNIHAVPTKKETVEKAAKKYASDLQLFFNEKIPRFDLIILGIGPDGHTASLFPNLYKPEENEDIVLAIKDSPKPPSERISFSMRTIRAAKNILIMASGKEKAPIIKDIFNNKSNLPAGIAIPKDGKLFWLMDKEAASLLN